MRQKLSLEEIDGIEDVGIKRFRMFQRLEEELDNLEPGISGLQEYDGYLYKLVQDFLTESPTYSKQEKLEKIVEHIERKYRD